MTVWLFFLLLSVTCAVVLYERVRDGRLGPDAGETEEVDWLRWRARFLHPIVQDIPIYIGRCAFCENKSRIYIRLRDPRGARYDAETVLCVLVHELAHVLAPVEADSHGPAFAETHAHLTRLAVEGGLFPDGFRVSEDYTTGCSL